MPREATPKPGSELLSGRLGTNLRALRESRGVTQAQMAKASGLPRATWAHLESGTANPTLAVLHKVANAVGVPFDELLGEPPSAARRFAKSELPTRERPGVVVRSLLPHRVPNMVLERMELEPGARMSGTPHTAGTREYLACERGRLELSVAGERHTLEAGDVIVFRGDQRHGYANGGTTTAVGYAIVVVRPA
jgi:XRE family transcriptional regulator, regulator of sulfur utilization